jgi:hypothetical protein
MNYLVECEILPDVDQLLAGEVFDDIIIDDPLLFSHFSFLVGNRLKPYYDQDDKNIYVSMIYNYFQFVENNVDLEEEMSRNIVSSMFFHFGLSFGEVDVDEDGNVFIVEPDTDQVEDANTVEVSESDLEGKEIVFAEGCFDEFEGTQEELDALVSSLKSGEFLKNAVTIDADDLPEEYSESQRSNRRRLN